MPASTAQHIRRHFGLQPVRPRHKPGWRHRVRHSVVGATVAAYSAKPNSMRDEQRALRRNWFAGLFKALIFNTEL